MDAAIEAVTRSPKIHQMLFGPFRRAFVRRFPYAVYYKHQESGDTVFVYVVIHTARDPKDWQDRLRDLP